MVRFTRKKTFARKRRAPYKYRSRRSFNPRRKSRAATLVRGPGPISDALRVKLKYHDSFVMTAAGVPAIHIYRTSLNAPDETGGTHQPMGYDQYGYFYNRYKVHGFSYKIWFINESTSQQCDVAAIPKPNATAIVTSNQLWESPYCRPRVVGVEGGRSMQFVKGYVDAARILGVSKLRYNTDDVYSATFTANPVETARLHLYAQPSNLSTTSTVRVKIDLTFYATLFDRHTLLTS